jgi:TolB-like protein/tetratricopeptide (TPR) repeat protein
MGVDEAGTARAVREHRAAAVPIVRSFGGRLVKTMGDGVLLEFPSVVAAVGCAIAIQKQMIARNEGVPDDKRIRYRIGVNLGDIIVDGDDILGDGVNVAARLETICEPGGVAASGSAYENFRGRIDANFTDLGEQALKNIARPVRVFGLSPQAVAEASEPLPPATEPEARPATSPQRRWAKPVIAATLACLAAGGLVWWSGALSRLATPVAEDKRATAPRLSIVVLPFTNLSSDPEQGYFADAVTDDLTTDLSHLDGSFVIAHDTALTYKGKPVDVHQIGHDLGVRYVLEGSVRRAGDDISINAQLISTETGAHAWADRFEGKRGDLGKLQVEVVARLANSLNVELVRAESLRASRKRPENLDADDLALQGWATFRQALTLKNLNTSIDLFERALRMDPGLLRAQTGLAEALSTRLNAFRDGANPKEDVSRVEILVTTALSTAPNDPRARVARTMLLAYERRNAEAMETDRGTLEVDPNNAFARGFYGLDHIFVGRSAEAVQEIETAMRLSPRDPFLNVWQYWACHAYAHLGEWEKSIPWCEKSLSTNDTYWMPYVDLASANGWLGREAEAKSAVQGLLKLRPGFTVQTWANIPWSDNATFKSQYARITEGLRKAGLPEGEKKTN